MLSIIIPHRDRVRTLTMCLWSLRRSATFCPDKDWEVVVADAGTALIPYYRNVEVVHDPTHGELFNKSRLLNIGIAESVGDVLVFLDADALVGTHFLESTLPLRDPGLTKLCYRVKCLPVKWLGTLERLPEEERGDRLDEFFADWDRYEKGFEGYGTPEDGWWRKHHGPPPEPIFGNSQFAIRREVLGDIRFNEDFVGGGYEDIWMNRELFRRTPNYRAEMVTEPEHAMFHLHEKRVYIKDDPWCDQRIIEANVKRYKRT